MLKITELHTLDIVLCSAYTVMAIIILFAIRNQISDKTRKYFIPYFLFKIITAIAFALIHVYYYKGGDTFLYFEGAVYFSNLILYEPTNLINHFFIDLNEISQLPAIEGYYILEALKSPDTIFMSKLTAPFALISANQFLTTTLNFTLFTSIGAWLIFTVFVNLYQKASMFFAIGTLFYPTLAIWTSGILKDSVTLLGLGILFFAIFKLLYHKKWIYLTLATLAIYSTIILKPYVLYIFIPSMLLWAQGRINQQIKSTFYKYLITPFIALSFILFGYLLFNEISESAGKYSLENLESIAKGFHSWHSYLAETRGQSGYTLGEVSYTPLGMLSKAPESLFVTFYRPFIFLETKNIPTLFEGIQSFLLLIITIYVIFKTGLRNILWILFKDTNLLAFLIFALIFAYAVGFTSYNFGALSRYKTPALPFFTAALTIIYFYSKKGKKHSRFKTI